MPLHPDEIAPDKIRPLRRVEYEFMVKDGMLEGENVELLYGMIVTKGAASGRHAHVLTELNMFFSSALVNRASVRIRMPLAASDISVPDPDLAVVKPGSRTKPKTAFLVIEISNSKRKGVCELKRALYAEANLPEYWVVDVVKKMVEVRTQPQEGQYRELAIFKHGKLSPKAFPDIEIDVDELFR